MTPGTARGDLEMQEGAHSSRKCVRLIQDMYRGSQTKVCIVAGESGSINVGVGL